MNQIIKVEIFGIKDQVLSSGCGCSKKQNGGCNGCANKKHSCASSGRGCGSNSGNHCSNSNDKASKTAGDLYKELESFIKDSDVYGNAELEFIDLTYNNLQEERYDRIKDVIDKGFELPITVVDDIIRYYGGISNSFVYKDIKELLED